MKVMVTSGKGFDDQAAVQVAMLDLKNKYPNATIIIGSRARGEVMSRQVWGLLGGTYIVDDPRWKADGTGAGRKRDEQWLDRGGVKLCISFVNRNGDESWTAQVCQQRGIKTWTYNEGVAIVDAG